MEYSPVTKKILECGIVAVIRGKTKEDTMKLSLASARGGIVGLEVTFTSPKADEVIAELKAQNDGSYCVGAGSVIDEATCRKALAAGAEFIVAPNFDERIARMCLRAQVPYIPGVFTPTEVIHAMNQDVEICKLFPGSAVGPSYIKAIHGPLPQVRIMPTGGVDLDNLEEWVKAGAVAVGIGSCLTGVAKNGDYDALTELAKQYVQKMKEARAKL